jgi:hypothetical protein
MTMSNADWRTCEGFRDEDNGAHDLYRLRMGRSWWHAAVMFAAAPKQMDRGIGIMKQKNGSFTVVKTLA